MSEHEKDVHDKNKQGILKEEDKGNAKSNPDNDTGFLTRYKDFPAGLAWTIVLASGGVVLFSYYLSINFLPTFDIKSVATLLAAVAFESVITVGMFGLMFAMPVLIIPSVELSDQRKQIAAGICFFWIVAAWIGLSYLLFSAAELFYYRLIVAIVAILFAALGVFLGFKKLATSHICMLDKKTSSAMLFYIKNEYKEFFLALLPPFFVSLGQILPFYIGILVLERSPIGYANIDESNTVFFIFKVFTVGAMLSTCMAWLLFEGGKKTKAAFVLAVCAPIIIGTLAETPSLFPTIAARETKTGGFMASQIVLDADGCKLVKSYLPTQQCGNDDKANYSLCGVFVRSRLGEQHYITVNMEPNPSKAEDVRLKNIIIPSTNVKSMSPSVNDHLAIQDDDIKRLLYSAGRRNYPCGGKEDVTQYIFESKNIKGRVKDKNLYFSNSSELLNFIAMAKKPPNSVANVQIYGAGTSSDEGEGFDFSDAVNLKSVISKLGIKASLVKIDWTGEGSGNCSEPDQRNSDRCKLKFSKMVIDVKRSFSD